MRAAEPFDLGHLELRNRLVGTAHGRGILEDGLPLPEDAEYWRRRAAGGAAMLTVGGTVVAPESTWRRRITTEAWRPEAVPGMAARAEAIRAEGAVAACQLVHLGRETTGAEQWFHPVAPSAVRSPREPTRPRPLSAGELDAIVEASAARRSTRPRRGSRSSSCTRRTATCSPSSCRRRRTRGGSPDDSRSSRASFARSARRPRGRRRGPAVDRGGGGLAPELLPHVDALADYVNLTVGVRTTYVRDMATEQPPLLAEVGRIRPLVDGPC